MSSGVYGTMMPRRKIESYRRTSHNQRAVKVGSAGAGVPRTRKNSGSGRISFLWLAVVAGIAWTADADVITTRYTTVERATTSATKPLMTRIPPPVSSSVPPSFFFQYDDQHRSLMRDKTTEGTDCEVVEECQLCDAAGKADIPQCAKTGRVERWRCNGEQEEGTYKQTSKKKTLMISNVLLILVRGRVFWYFLLLQQLLM